MAGQGPESSPGRAVAGLGWGGWGWLLLYFMVGFSAMTSQVPSEKDMAVPRGCGLAYFPEARRVHGLCVR